MEKSVSYTHLDVYKRQVLNIKPILTTVGEKFDAIEKVRGMKKSLAKLLDYTEEFVNKTLAEKPDAEIRIGAAGTFTNDQAARCV